MMDVPARVQTRRPLVHCITNLVTIQWVAQGLLAAGAVPLMARDPAEAAAAAGAAGAVLLNLGTWHPEVHAAMVAAGQAANRRGIPVVLDPVGAGGLATRTAAALQLAAGVRLAAVRGNAGEIAALAAAAGAPGPGPDGDARSVRGVDATRPDAAAAAPAARALARRWGCIVACTGPVDLVTDGSRTLMVHAGHRLLAQVPGTGCLAGALVGAALAAGTPDEDALGAVAGALLWLGAAGERAAAAAGGPGTFAAALLDALAMPGEQPRQRVRPPLAERLRLYAIVNGETPLAAVAAMVAGGTGAVQFREKRLPLADQVAAAAQMARVCREAGALFVVNDRLDVALAVDAEGVHLGQDDLPVAAARRILGPHRIIGATCETPEEVRRAEAAGADYLGVGPVYATATKPDAGAPYGPEVIRRACAAARLPVVGIGGIGPGRAAAVVTAGAAGVAVASAILQAADPHAAAGALRREVDQALSGGMGE